MAEGKSCSGPNIPVHGLHYPRGVPARHLEGCNGHLIIPLPFDYRPGDCPEGRVQCSRCGRLLGKKTWRFIEVDLNRGKAEIDFAILAQLPGEDEKKTRDIVMTIVRKKTKDEEMRNKEQPLPGRIPWPQGEEQPLPGRIPGGLNGLLDDDSPQHVPPRTERGIEKALKSMDEIIHSVADQDRGSRIEEPGVMDPRPLKIKYSPETLKMHARKRILERKARTGATFDPMIIPDTYESRQIAYKNRQALEHQRTKKIRRMTKEYL